jgi:hypothetical protein
MAGGVFITKGMEITIPAGTNFLSGTIAIQARYDVCPVWLKLSLDHLGNARTCRDDRRIAWHGDDDQLKASTLEREFEASMQAIVSAAIAIDAFYAVVKDKAPSAIAAKRAPRRPPPRSAQVSEAIKEAFQLKPKGFAILRDCAKKIYHLRDLAVHPKGSAGDTIVHPELSGGVGVEWRLVYYRYESAFGVVRATIGMLNDLACNGKPKTEALKKYCAALSPQTEIFFANEVLSV